MNPDELPRITHRPDGYDTKWAGDPHWDPQTNGYKPSAETLRLYTPAELLEFPEPTWLVQPFIVDGCLSILYGASGTFKSFIALSWAAIAPGLAIYISAEGSPKRLGERIQALEQDAGHQPNVLTLPHALNLIHDTDQLVSTIDTLPIAPRLLIVDTAARNMAGSDENSTRDMGSLIGQLDTIRSRYQMSILVIHHSGHENTDRERGSSALRGAADISIHAKRGESPLEVRIRCAKSRDTAEFPPSVIRLIPKNETLIAAQAITNSEALDDPVSDYLKTNPNASQREVEKAITGKTDDIREAYKRVRPSAPYTRGAPQGSAPLETPLPLKGEGAGAHPHD